MDISPQLATQRTYFQEVLKTSSVRERIYTLKKLKRWLKKNTGRVEKALETDLGKSAPEAQIGSIKGAVVDIKDAINNLRSWSDPKQVSTPIYLLGTSSKVICEPKGLVLIMAPWNYPFILCFGPLVSAIAAGNAVVLKPSEFTSATSALLAEMVKEVFNPDHVSVVQGDGEMAAKLLEERFDHIFFTGSPTIGKKVMAAASKHLTPVTLELGGQNPCVIDKGVNLKDAVNKVVWSKYLNSGQLCMSPNHVFVHSSIKDKFTKLLLERIDKWYNHLSPALQPCRIIHEKHFDGLVEKIEQAKKEGGEVLTPEDRDKEKLKIFPTVIENVGWESHLVREEIFGPIIPLLTFDDVGEVINHINKGEKPLAMTVFSKSRAVRKRFEQETSSGALLFNEFVVHFTHPNLPFGGVGNSGMGRGHGEAGFRTFSNEKAVLTQGTGFTTPKLVYPPYTTWTKRMISWFVKYF